MNTTYYEKEERQISRSEKIQLAKSAFSHGNYSNSGYAGYGYSRLGTTRETHDTGRDTTAFRYGVTGGSEMNLSMEEGRHHFGMLRMVIAGMLFFVLVFSFHFEISYKGYDKSYVEQVLSDNSKWESLVNQVTQVMKQNVDENQ